MLKPLGSVLSAASDQLGARRHLRRSRLQEVWREVVGDLLARQSEPIAIKGETLLVRTTAAPWSVELMLRQAEILNRLAPHVGRLKSLRCKVGAVAARAEDQSPETAEAIDWEAIPVPPSRLEEIERLAGEVDDPDLAARLKRLLVLLARRDRLELERGRLPCPTCGRFREPAQELCTFCRLERNRQRKQKLMQIIGRQPWLGLSDVRDRLPDLRAQEYHEARKQLRSLLLSSVWGGYRAVPDGAPLPATLRTAMVELATLATGLPFDQLQNRHMIYALGKTLGRAYLENQKFPLP